MFEFTKPHHKALLVTEDHRIVERNLIVDSGFLVDHRANRAWALMPHAVIRMRGTRTPYVVLYERAAAPFSAVAKRWLPLERDAVKQLAKGRVAESFAELPRLAIQEKLASTMRICIAGLTLTVAAMAVTVLMSSGQLRIPGF